MANAKHVRRWGRRDRKYEARRTTKPLIAGNYVKIVTRPQRPYHAIVSHNAILSYNSLLLTWIDRQGTDMNTDLSMPAENNILSFLTLL